MGKRKNQRKVTRRKRKNNSSKSKQESTKTFKKTEKINKREIYHDITNEEIINLEKAIEEDYFDFSLDCIELYENNIINDKQYELEKYIVNVDDNFYNNIPLDEINNIKKLIKDTKNLKIKDINYDFINNKTLVDTYINNKLLNNSDDSIEDSEVNINEEESKLSCNNSDNNETEENDNENLNEPQLLDNKFISYEKKYSLDHKIWWPIKLYYGWKKYYTSSNAKYLSNKSTNIIRYYCVNHRINTVKKKLLFKKNKCNGKLEYHRNTGKFFLITEHNKICKSLY